MGSFTMPGTTAVPELHTAVLVNGQRRSDVFCTSVSLGAGTAGSTASLEVPSHDWDDNKQQWRGAFVQVRVAYGAGGWRDLFNGYVNGALGSYDDGMQTLEARSLIALSDTVYVGQHNGVRNDLVVQYPQRARRNGVELATGWDVRGVLRDIFSSSAGPTWRGGGGSLPSAWRSRLRLGSLSVLSRSFNRVPLGDVIFRQSTLREALDLFLGLIGTVSFRERFQGVATFLEFFEVGDPSAPVRTMRVARPGESIAGTNVLTVSHQEGLEDVKNRIIAMGAPRKYVVMVGTDHSTAPLEKLWDETLESSILTNVEGKGAAAPVTEMDGESEADPPAPTEEELLAAAALEEERARVFRRYRLPAALRNLRIDKENAIELSDGRRLGIQVMKSWRRLAFNSGTGAWVGTPAGFPELLTGFAFDPATGELTLAQPAISLVSAALNESNQTVETWEEANVWILLTVLGERLSYDTRTRRSGFTLQGIGNDGLGEVVLNESFGFRQMSNDGFPIVDSEGTEHTFDDAWVFVDGDGWTRYLGSTVFQDDNELLRVFTDMTLREKNRVRETYAVTSPFLSWAVQIGERIAMVGQDDFRFGTHQVMSISHALGHDHQTTISTENNIPMTASDVLGG